MNEESKGVLLEVTEQRHRYGCDGCKVDTSTQQFIGYCGDVLWLCHNCFKKMTMRWEYDE